jgi:hypothetical protein
MNDHRQPELDPHSSQHFTNCEDFRGTYYLKDDLLSIYCNILTLVYIYKFWNFLRCENMKYFERFMRSLISCLAINMKCINLQIDSKQSIKIID